jgi:Tol biopolymer transport system component
MSFYHLAQHVTRLLLSLTILMSCFAPAINFAGASISTSGRREADRAGGSFSRSASPTDALSKVNRSGRAVNRVMWSNAALTPSLLPAAMLVTNDESDLVLNPDTQPGVVEPNGTVNFNSTIYNYGPDEATGASLTATFPPEVTVNTASTPAGSCTITPILGVGTTVTCPLGDMPVWDVQTASINATIDASDGVNLEAGMIAESASDDPDADNSAANPIVLVRDSQPGPSGTLAFVSYRDGDAEVYLTDADGSSVVNLTNNPAYDWEPAWSPDGTKLVFNSDRSGAEELWLMDADGSNPTRLTTNGSNGVNFVWSPDGTKIAWQNWDSSTDNYDICVVNADGTGFSNLTNDTEYQNKPQWSPDGTKILYQGEVYDSLTATFHPNILLMNADGSGKTNLTNNTAAYDFAPVWSPDGTQIAFNRRIDSPGIYVMDADGSDQVNLTNNDHDGSPSWSPDGTKIAFSRFISSTSMIYVMDADGSNQSPVFTENFNDGAKVEWSPDSSGLAFDTYRDDNSEVYVVNLDGSGLSNATNDGDYDFEAKWRPTVTP